MSKSCDGQPFSEKFELTAELRHVVSKTIS